MLQSYVKQKKQWTSLDCDKLWKALYYCMWMSDKTTIQLELAGTLSKLMHRFTCTEYSVLYIESFLKTMQREWGGLDQYRLDKFYSLIRFFTNEIFILLRRNQWDLELIHQVMRDVNKHFVSTRPNGLRLHLAEIFLDELKKVGSKSLTPKTSSCSAWQSVEAAFLSFSSSSSSSTGTKHKRCAKYAAYTDFSMGTKGAVVDDVQVVPSCS